MQVDGKNSYMSHWRTAAGFNFADIALHMDRPKSRAGRPRNNNAHNGTPQYLFLRPWFGLD